jgi:cytochrome c oxidase subunit II
MSPTLVIVAVALIFIVIFQLAKISEYTSILKGKEGVDEENNNYASWMFMGFLVISFILVVWSLYKFVPMMLPVSASVHGKWIDSMFNVTLFFTGIVFVACQVALFYFAWRYSHRKDRKALYFPENNKLEIWWTIIPAIVMTGLVIIGVYRWFEIMGPAPATAQVIEITGKQFNWIVRYPGTDGKLGAHDFRLIDETNQVGIDFTDPNSKDDIMPNDIHLLVNKPVMLKIQSRDVIHDVGLPQFRVHMDAVPGIPTTFWFTPDITTDEMKKITGNANFQYELVCDQLCGKGHFSMKMNVFVDSPDEYAKWIASQKSFYESAIKGTPEEQKAIQAAQQLHDDEAQQKKLTEEKKEI